MGKRKGSGTDGYCRADKALRVQVQRSVGSSSRVREMKKNLAYQPARDPVIWAAYMPRKVGPLGACSWTGAKSARELWNHVQREFKQVRKLQPEQKLRGRKILVDDVKDDP